MPNLVAEGEMLARLKSLEKNSTTMIVDSSGKMVGLFTPAAHPSLQCPYSDEEIRERAKSKGRGITTSELLELIAEVEKRRNGNDPSGRMVHQRQNGSLGDVGDRQFE